MPLSKVEREVLEVIYEEHRQTHRGAKALIVHVGMNAKTGEQKARIVDVLHALQKRGLLVAGADSWVPTKEGVNYIEQPGWIGVDMAIPDADKTSCCDPESQRVDAEIGCDKCGAVLCDWDAKQYGEICNNCFKDLEEAPIAVETTAKPAPPSPLPFEACSASIERIGAPLPSDLLNRCAAMNTTLLAQAEQAYVAGDPDAWRDLAWLIETGKQLVAMQEVNHG
ncbi:hypothetical protein [Halomonas sp. MES3-P3E]|uniref:hypothetical protein n=1 Tax=Halomonas sp. MES3-P3E TaxID=2058321 RepID=UPI000C34F9B0|nr:hypothetical protein [Halomonas sp. MES3-P3E]PKG49623.1 hypothetical protein CXF87_12155 [Halomonas sp. MES3-P3E]